MLPPKYPKTHHIQGSKGQEGEDMEHIEDFDHIVVEEKLDGSEVSIFFSDDGNLQVWHRNNPVSSPEYDWLKEKLYTKVYDLRKLLEDRYVLFGEWLYAKHTVFYDELSDYFYAFDVYDSVKDVWMSTQDRYDFLEGLDFSHVPVVYQGPGWEFDPAETLESYSSKFKSNHLEESLIASCRSVGIESEDDIDDIIRGTDLSGKPEGWYIKAEPEIAGVQYTTNFMKYIRPEFLDTILSSGSHWKDRKIIPNLLADTEES